MKYLLLFFAFLSGFVSLAFGVLSQFQLVRLFGRGEGTSSFATICFMLGLGSGAWFWARMDFSRNALNLFARLQLVGAMAVFTFWYAWKLSMAIYPALLPLDSFISLLSHFFKPFMALMLVGLPGFFIGGNLPLLGKLYSGSSSKFGRSFSSLYTFFLGGGLLGLVAGGGFLPPLLGFNLSFKLLASMLVIQGVFALAAGFHKKGQFRQKKSESGVLLSSFIQENKRLSGILFLTGFITMGTQILSTRMFSLVSFTHVYASNTMFLFFILALFISAVLAVKLLDASLSRRSLLLYISGAAGALLVIAPRVFWNVTGGLKHTSADSSLMAQSLRLISTGGAALFLPVILLGVVFLLFVSRTRKVAGAKEAIGLCLFLNALGAITAEVLIPFIMLPSVGLWHTLILLGGLCPLLGFSTRPGSSMEGRRLQNLLPAGVITLVIVALLFPVPELRLRPANRETLVEHWNSPTAAVSVIKANPDHFPPLQPTDLYIKVNNYNNMPGTGSAASEKRQGHLPLWIHSDPARVFFMGLGTGITATAFLDYDLDQAVISELLPEVMEAGIKHFAPYISGLFTNGRTWILTMDGNEYLRRNKKTFDVIIGDILHPLNRTTGDYFSREHFTEVYKKLTSDGVFAQWLPMHRLTERDFGIIARTFVEVFPNTTLWRGNFTSREPVFALVGQRNNIPLDPDTFLQKPASLYYDSLKHNTLIDALYSIEGLSILKTKPGSVPQLRSKMTRDLKKIPFTLYAGNPGFNRQLFADYPLNTLNKPVLEYFSAHRNMSDNTAESRIMKGDVLQEFLAKLFDHCSPEIDPYLVKLEPRHLHYVEAGLIYQRYFTLRQRSITRPESRDAEEADNLFKAYLERLEISGE